LYIAQILHIFYLYYILSCVFRERYQSDGPSLITKHVKTNVLIYSILKHCSITESVYNFQRVQTKI